MKKQILNLGKALSKKQLRGINGGGILTGCVNQGDFCDWISQSGYGTGTCEVLPYVGLSCVAN